MVLPSYRRCLGTGRSSVKQALVLNPLFESAKEPRKGCVLRTNALPGPRKLDWVHAKMRDGCIRREAFFDEMVKVKEGEA